ncbi:MAG: site-specific recombinase XerD [uncultured bacterium]|nr:MAG: site-specific recombinase XerD [uncultured bacterium]
MKISDYTTEFLQYRKIKYGICSSSVDKYREGLKTIDKTMDYADLLSIDQNTIFNWIGQLEKRYSSHTRRSLVGLFRSLMEYLKDVKKMDVFDYKEIALPKPEYKPVKYLSNKEVDEIIEQLPEKHLRDLRFKALFCLLVSSGGRINEVLNIELDDVDFENREALVLGKGKKYRKIFFDERAEHYIKKFISKR